MDYNSEDEGDLEALGSTVIYEEIPTEMNGWLRNWIKLEG